MKRALAFLSLFSSISTLFCCALPAFFVLLGFGATFAGLVGAFPQLIWLSEHKLWTFGLGGFFLIAFGIIRFAAAHSQVNTECPPERALNEACAQTKDWSGSIFQISLTLYIVGAFFAFIAQRVF